MQPFAPRAYGEHAQSAAQAQDWKWIFVFAVFGVVKQSALPLRMLRPKYKCRHKVKN